MGFSIYQCWFISGGLLISFVCDRCCVLSQHRDKCLMTAGRATPTSLAQEISSDRSARRLCYRQKTLAGLLALRTKCLTNLIRTCFLRAEWDFSLIERAGQNFTCLQYFPRRNVSASLLNAWRNQILLSNVTSCATSSQSPKNQIECLIFYQFWRLLQVKYCFNDDHILKSHF